MGSRIKSAPAWDRLTQLVVLGICFAAGTLGGFLFSGWGEQSPELLDYLSRYFEIAAQGSGVEPGLLSSAWDLIRWPLASFLLGVSAFGVVGIPALLALRGFLLAYSAAIFARLFGLPQKGRIEEGRDADLVLVERLQLPQPLDIGTLFTKSRDSAELYRDLPLRCRVAAAYVRGRRVFADGAITGEQGWGKFVSPV